MEPGKIVHELRECELANLRVVPFGRYYGSVDSTPLFVALAGLYWQRTRDEQTLEAIWPNILSALGWIEQFGDRDRDGFVEYGRMRDTGLRNQGWKDSDDSVFHADGTLAAGPIADLDDLALSRSLYQRADALRARFDAAFWDEDLGTYAIALDRNKQPCRIRTSNAAQLLFTGIALPHRAARIARDLLGREFFSGWGIRTLATGEQRYNPISYHNGSIWPHDNALIALGLAQYGYTGEAVSITQALFDAAAHMHLRRLPELFCGFERRRGKAPTPYPVACAPQAWAACTPIALIQACLGLEVDAASSTVILRRPRLPHFIDWLTVKNLRVGESTLDLLFKRHDGSVAVTLLSRRGDAQVEVML
jgi:glycogen debranching enzyme